MQREVDVRRTQSGIFLIEVLVVTGIVLVVTAMAAVTVPRAQEKARQVESINNVRNIALLMAQRSMTKGWPRFDGKSFVLSLVAYGMVDRRNPQNLEVFFSPGDELYALVCAGSRRYEEITVQALRSGTDFHELTSYAGRRNADRDYMITPDQMSLDVPILCDDDDGSLHHPEGLVVAFTSGAARFMTWAELGMVQPEDRYDPEPFLGDNASVELLQALSSE